MIGPMASSKSLIITLMRLVADIENVRFSELEASCPSSGRGSVLRMYQQVGRIGPSFSHRPGPSFCDALMFLVELLVSVLGSNGSSSFNVSQDGRPSAGREFSQIFVTVAAVAGSLY